MSFLYYAEGLGQTDEFKFFITLNLTVYIISYTQYKNHIHENGVFSGERVHVQINITQSIFCQVIV